MRTRIIRKIGVLATLLCLALLGCDMGNTPHDAKPTEAKVRVIIGTDAEGAAQAASRTVVPANPGFTYTLSFSAAGRTTVTAPLDGSAGEVSLNTGDWTLSVTGKKNGETVAESDPVDVTVSEEGTTVSVIVHPTLDGAKGTFRYAVSADAALSEVSAVLTPLNVGNAEQSAITLPLESATEQSVAAGYYRLTVRALKGAQPLIRRETVHVYSSTETYKSYTLTTGDFAAVIYLGGVLSGGITGYTPVAVAAYEDAAGRVPIDESAVNEDWRLAVEDTLDTVYFKVRLEKDGETYYSKLITVSDIPASGRLDIALAIEGYTVTFDANGGAFAYGGAIMTLTALENETLAFLPTASQSGRAFAGWYSAGERFTAETRISGDTALYAEWALGAADIAGYLANAEGGESAANPVPLVVSMDLANGGWEALLATINTGGKYVSLDLSTCTMDGTEFVPGTDAGANRVAALVLPDVAKSIPAGTFSNNTYYATFRAFANLAVISGAGVETIGGEAFNRCTSLTTVSLPAATSIGDYAFEYCTSLTTVSLPVATSIGGFAFYECTSLTSVSLPAAQTIDIGAFNRCTSLTAVSLPAAQTIATGAFYRCTSLPLVSLPAATSIGDNAFDGCTHLTTVSLPAAETIGNEAFSGCTSLTTVSLPAATTIAGGGNYAGAFYGCTSLTSVSLPAAQTIGSAVFNGCTSLTSVSLPATPPAISSIFFYTGSSGTIIVSVPTGAVSAYTSTWGVSASTAASGNTSVYGSSHKAVFITDAAPLTGLDGLASAPGGNTADNPVSLALSGSFTNDSWMLTLAVINGVGKYVSLDLSACTMTGTEFTPGTYAGANRVTALVLPNAAKSIPAGTASTAAFSAFTALRSLSGANVETIGDYAFYGHGFLTSVSLPTAQTVGTQAFYGCTNLTSVSLPAATDIGASAFNGCTSLTAVSLPAATDIGERAFYACTSLTSVSLPAATDIGDNAFNGCTSLAGVSLPAATSIGNYAFGVGTSLATVSLPATPPAISSIFFYTGSSGTITVRVPAGAVSAYTSTWGVDATTPAGGNTSAYGSSHKAVFITDAAPLTGLDGLANAPGGDTADNPVSLALSGNLTNDSWAITLTVIAGAGKYVSLDLSACTMTETEFAPGTYGGAYRVTALVLPDAAKNIPAGTSSSAAFSAFTALRSLSGANVETIGAYAFNGCTNLTTVSLPAATTIGNNAFSACTSLTSVSLPATPPSIGSGFFASTGSSGTIIVRVPAGAVSAYTSAWGVSADTSAGGNTSVYGSSHKAVIITDAAPLTGLDGLANASGGDTADNPVSLALSGSFTNDRWALTLAVIAEAGKYVSLDLSACTMTETEFAPGTYAGANRVTALVLPDAAKSIPAGTRQESGSSYTYYATFSAFTALGSLSGAGVETIGSVAFYGTRLREVSLPAATYIGGYAFYGCTRLREVSLPAATSIDIWAFQGCTSLTTVSLPATPPSIRTGYYDGIFSNTGSSGTITIRVPAGVVFAYTSTWGVDANTPAGSNQSVYGYEHKAVLITDAAQ